MTIGNDRWHRPAVAAGVVLAVGMASSGAWYLAERSPTRPVAQTSAAPPPTQAAPATPDETHDGLFASPGSPTAPSPAPTRTPSRTSSTCTKPAFVTSDRDGGWSTQGYYVHNNMWNDSVPLGTETLSACAHDNWYVVSNQTNSAGAVKTYPNVHKDYGKVRLSTFSTVTSTFAGKGPGTGIYNVAYDIWTNGIASAGSTEFMIWTENHKQVPAGRLVRTTTVAGETFDVWKTSDNHYIAFVPKAVMPSGTLDLLAIMRWAMSQGWLPADSTLGQICFGVEIVSTDGKDATFTFTDFSVSSR